MNKEKKPKDVKIVKGKHAVRACLDRLTHLKHGQATLAELMGEAHKALWKTLNENYPTYSDWICTLKLDEDELMLVVLYKKRSADENFDNRN